MAYTLDQAVTQVRYLINEDTADFWSDTEIEDWIKQATIKISTSLLSAEDEDTITISNEGKFIYDSSDESWIADLLKIKSCYYETTSDTVMLPDAATDIYGMQRVELDMFGHTQQFQTYGRPVYYYENNRKIYIWPRPSIDQRLDTIHVLYSYETDDITDLRNEHQPLTFLYAAGKAKAKDRQHQEAALYMAQFLNSINFERQDKYDLGVEPTAQFNVP